MGDTGVSLPPLGFGAAAIGNLYRAVSDEEARSAIEAAVEGGLAYFDTAPHYGFGLSERRLGESLPPRGGSGGGIRISTKVGRRLVPVQDPAAGRERHGFVEASPFEPVFDYSYEGVMSSFRESLARLRRETIDVLFAHDLGALTHGERHRERFREFLEGGYPAMRQLKAEGLVGAIGIGVNEIDVCLEALQEIELDCILLAGRYTLLEQEPLDVLLPACAARGVSVIVGGPFNSGILAEFGKGEAQPRHYNYELAPPEVVERVERISRVCAAHATPLAAAALQFPLAHPSVAAVIPGLSSPAQVRDALRFSSFEIPMTLWDDLKSEGLLPPAAPTPTSNTRLPA